MIYLGCSGWSYNHWVGKFYRKSLRRSKWLEFYAQHFNTVEVNSTFYKLPSKSMFKSWFKRAPPNFIFTLKANRQLTHEGALDDPKKKRLIAYFYSLADNLGEKLGCILFQFPPSAKKDVKVLRGFINNLDEARKNVIEFRHKSWYSKKVYEVLHEARIGYCIVSAPRLPTQLKLTADYAYIRWHGVKNWYRYNYSKAELEDWARVIRKKLKQAKQIYGYFNNDFECNAVKNCKELKEILGEVL